MIAARVRWQAIDGQIIAQRQTRIAMATSAGFRGNILGIQGRVRTLLVDDQVLSLAVYANGRVPHAGLDRDAMDAFVELAGDFLVALRAGLGHFPVIDPGALIGGRIDVMTAMATGTGGRILAERDRARVNALLVRIDRMSHRNLVPRQEPRIAVALGASIGNVPGGDGRDRFSGAFHGVDGTVAGNAFGRVRVALLRGLSMDGGCEVLHFLGMTLGTLSGHQFFGGGEFVDAAMTRRAGRFAEDEGGAGGKRLGLVRMAGSALHSGDFRGMREFPDRGMAIFAAENRVRAGSMFGRVN